MLGVSNAGYMYESKENHSDTRSTMITKALTVISRSPSYEGVEDPRLLLKEGGHRRQVGTPCNIWKDEGEKIGVSHSGTREGGSIGPGGVVFRSETGTDKVTLHA